MQNSKPLFDTTSISQKTYELLKERILDSFYQPGDRIELAKLCEELGISQTPIKDALFRLDGEGLIEVLPRKGVYVKQISKKEINEIFDARIMIETGVLETVIKKVSNRQLKELHRLFAKSLNSNGEMSYKEFMKISYEFHSFIVNVTDNNTIIEIYKRLNVHMKFLLYQVQRGVEERLPLSNNWHHEILKSLQERNLEKARIAIRDHLLMTKESLQSNVKFSSIKTT